MKDKNKYGQYFTIDSIAQFMVGLIHHDKGANVLEPSCGKGVFLKHLQAEGFSNLSAYEIDETLGNEYPFVEYRSFISAPIIPFDVVIGNPPYIRWKNLESDLKEELNRSPLWNKYFNSLCDYLFIFILKSIEHLTENGELIFICTEYWLNTTHSQSLRDYMARNGFFAEIYHFKEAPLFEGVCASFIVFRYVKHRNKAETISLYRYNQTGAPDNEALAAKSCFDLEIIPRFKEGERWLLATAEQQKRLSSFEEKCSTYAFDLFSAPQMHRIGDVCDIGNGMVSGLDKAFNVSCIQLTDDEEQHCIRVIKAKDLDRYQSKSESKYFFIQERVSNEEFEERFPNVCQHMRPYVKGLKERYDYGKAPNYWEFVFPRNLSLFSREEPRILVPCKERISNKGHFRFALAPSNYYPLQDVTGLLKKKSCKESIEYLLAFLNNQRVFEWLGFNGIVKGYIVEFSEAPIASIPYREIDWNDEKEVKIHEQITSLVRSYLLRKDVDDLCKIENLFNSLFA